MMHSGIVMGHRKNVSQNNGSDGSQRSSQSISVLPFLGLCAITRAFRPVLRLNGGVPTQPHSVSVSSLASLARRANCLTIKLPERESLPHERKLPDGFG